MSNIQSVEQQLKNAGLLIEKALTFGKLVRVAATNVHGKRKAKAGWYALYEYTRKNGEVIICGAFGNHTLTIQETIKNDIKEWTQQERDEYRAKMLEQEKAAEQATKDAQYACIAKAQKIWPNLPDTGVNEYLNRKKIKGFGVRFCKGQLVVPMFNKGELVSLQWIKPDGQKTFMTGTPKKGSYFLIGKITEQTNIVALVEGYATGASVHMATGWPVFVAFDAGNLEPVAVQIRQKFEHIKIIICADKDDSRVGEQKAQKAAQAVNAVVVLPVFKGAA